MYNNTHVDFTAFGPNFKYAPHTVFWKEDNPLKYIMARIAWRRKRKFFFKQEQNPTILFSLNYMSTKLSQNLLRNFFLNYEIFIVINLHIRRNTHLWHIWKVRPVFLITTLTWWEVSQAVHYDLLLYWDEPMLGLAKRKLAKDIDKMSNFTLNSDSLELSCNLQVRQSRKGDPRNGWLSVKGLRK